MLMTLPKLAAMAGCAVLGLAGTWLALAEAPASAHAMKPCAALSDEAASRPQPAPHQPLEVQWQGGPLDTPHDDSEDPAVVVDDTDEPQLTSVVNYYHDGDVIQTTFRDDNGVVRRTGTYVIALTKPEPEPSIDPIVPTTEEEAKIKKLLEEVECIERCVRKIDPMVFGEESDFDASRVPPGMECTQLRDGTWREFREDGSCASENNWRRGNLDGAAYTWHANGVLAQSGAYINGAHAGRWTTYRDNGQIEYEYGYTNGVLDGAYNQYNANGRLFASASYESGQLSGGWTYYDDNGNALPSTKTGEKLTKRVTRCGVAPAGRKIDVEEPIEKSVDEEIVD
ncbi:MAG: toxin-antitoxin system YwqK family antitoxin [Planctomycetes bacterium]|nr:toxin-antitoxin system YwqK family antitoxin [Planctomycetota bacterium]